MSLGRIRPRHTNGEKKGLTSQDASTLSYGQDNRIRTSKIINDPIHGHFELAALVRVIIRLSLF